MISCVETAAVVVPDEAHKGGCQDRHKICVLLVNMHLLAVRPIVVTDEPRRFSREQKAFQVINEVLAEENSIHTRQV